MLLAEILDHLGPRGVAVGDDARELAFGDQRPHQRLGEGGDGLGKIAPVKINRRSGQLPMAGGRILAARGLDAKAPLAARFGERKAPRRAAGRSLHRVAKAERLEARQPQGAAAQALAVAFACRAGLGDMAERIRSLIAVSLGVLRAAAAGGVEDDEDRAGHGPLPAPSTVLRTVPLPRRCAAWEDTHGAVGESSPAERGRGTMP